VKLLVYIRDGRTVYALRGRGELSRLARAEPWGEEPSVVSVRGTWNPVTGRFVWQPNVHLRHLARGSISHVEEGDPNQAAGGRSA
jgi:hypothetical protein